ncbi:NAD(P)H-quinone oxidoreductase subunit I, chloroplastic [subsurface metagenome]
MKLNRRDFLKVSAGTTGLILLNSPEKASANDSPSKSGIAVLVDTSKCVGCWWCYAACKHAHNLPETIKPDNEHPPKLDSSVWTTLCTKKNGNEWLYAKRQCMHCEHPACVTACPVGALQKTAEGPVVYDEQKCFGCRYCMVACPFGVPDFEWEDPTPWIRKCDFCADRLAPFSRATRLARASLMPLSSVIEKNSSPRPENVSRPNRISTWTTSTERKRRVALHGCISPPFPWKRWAFLPWNPSR